MKSTTKEAEESNMQIPHWYNVSPFFVALKIIFQNSTMINCITNSKISKNINNLLFLILAKILKLPSTTLQFNWLNKVYKTKILKIIVNCTGAPWCLLYNLKAFLYVLDYKFIKFVANYENIQLLSH